MLGCLEIKCPYSVNGNHVRHLPPEEIAEQYQSFFLEKCPDGCFQLKRGHKYFAQVQGEMALMNVSWCDFVVYTAGGIFIERIYFDGDFWYDPVLPALKGFFVQHVAPELISRRLLKTKQAV